MPVTINASTSAGLVQTADTSGTLALQANGTTVLSATPTGVAVTGTLTATGGFPGITSGQIQTQLFTAPGTWTWPATTTQVRVTVIGGGGGSTSSNNGTSGGTSSFGSAVSATGGTLATPVFPSGQTAPGTGTVSVGTAIRTGNVRAAISGETNNNALGISVSVNMLSGIGVNITDTTSYPAGISFSTSSNFMAGASGGSTSPSGNLHAGAGGYAIAIVPVSAPVAVTVGNGGAKVSPNLVYAGVGGAVLVEFVS